MATYTCVEASVDPQASHDIIAADGGWKSRKFWAFMIVIVAIFGAGLLGATNKFHLFDVNVVVDGIIVAFFGFIGANVTTKFAADGIAKAAVKAAGPADDSKA